MLKIESFQHRKSLSGNGEAFRLQAAYCFLRTIGEETLREQREVFKIKGKTAVLMIYCIVG